jgi:hypothetical protein
MPKKNYVKKPLSAEERFPFVDELIIYMNGIKDFFSFVKDVVAPSDNSLGFITKKRFNLLSEVDSFASDNDKKLQTLVRAVKLHKEQRTEKMQMRKSKKVFFCFFLI